MMDHKIGDAILKWNLLWGREFRAEAIRLSQGIDPDSTQRYLTSQRVLILAMEYPEWARWWYETMRADEEQWEVHELERAEREEVMKLLPAGDAPEGEGE